LSRDLALLSSLTKPVHGREHLFRTHLIVAVTLL
jgi:hypothetical protein